MITKQALMVVLLLVLANVTFAQSGRLRDLSNRLANNASEFADATYRDYTGSNNNNRRDIEATMLAQQFSAAAQLFNRMVNDRRRTPELRDAYRILQNLSGSISGYNRQQSTWYTLQRTMSDIDRELGSDRDDQYPGPGPSSGRMTWRGRVDDDVRINVRGGRAEIETLGGSPYYDGISDFSSALPFRRVTVRLNVRKGRGQVFIEQQPTRDNDFTAVIRIRDPKGGASDYEFELSW
jgi:hypothetical protein